MKSYRYIQGILFAVVAFALVSCADDDLFPVGGEETVVTFMPTISNGIDTRSIGEGLQIDRLIVGVYADNGGNVGDKILQNEMAWADAQRDGVAMTLIEGRTYHILFWAQDADNSAYVMTDDGRITADYDDYKSNGSKAGFASMEQLDAFYATAVVTVGADKIKDEGAITLTRPLAQVNFADKTTQPVAGSHKAVVTYSNYPTAFNPFAGTVEMSQTPIEFTFTDFPAETLGVGSDTYFYLACNYFFAPDTGSQAITSTTLSLQDNGGSELKNVQLIDNGTDDNRIVLQQNMKTNVYGNIVAQPQTWSKWDGSSETEPGKDSENRYVIDAASDLVWLSKNGSTLPADGTFVQTIDIDMNNHTVASVQLPAGSTYDGGGKQIINYKNTIFGDATRITVKNLSVEGVTASSATHVGVLINTLKGSSRFENITIANSSATTAGGAAGGIVGYIVRESEKTRTETLTVAFNGCKLTDVTVVGSESEGKMVGLLSGYDNNESLTFDAACEANNVSVADYSSVYKKANQSAWVAGTLDAKYDGWLGHEKYRRAKISFAGVRLAPRWDGTIDATVKSNLIKYNEKDKQFEVHSPFDLAAVQNTNASPEALYLMENVDMHGQGADGKYDVPNNWTQSAYASDDDIYFKSFSTITYLDGNGNGIYNMNVNTQKVSTSLYYGGFIRSTTGTTTHQNIKFYDSCVVVPHVVYKNEDKGSAGMLVSNIAGDSYTMNNVHTYGCKIFALQKVGGLAARVAATSSTITNCSVNNCYIENYKCEENPETFSGGNSLASVSATFYSYGEVGGMFGFVEQNTTIDNCQVNGTTIYAFGQDDKAASKSGFAIILYEYYTVPGRHVSTFIGDVRTTASNGGTITMTNISVDTNTKCTNRQQDKHNNKCETIGRVYFLFLNDDEGEVHYNGTKLKLQNCKNNQNRNQ